ncbi:hypothetical protein PT974_00440 [Cladobotryum mycophilum]|uniref:Uncharacterized protein n=1 Tax=Cladobotryum mycophilum TaxID=491253 RepID=A0ABR0T0T7_9HYPO
MKTLFLSLLGFISATGIIAIPVDHRSSNVNISKRQDGKASGNWPSVNAVVTNSTSSSSPDGEEYKTLSDIIPGGGHADMHFSIGFVRMHTFNSLP